MPRRSGVRRRLPPDDVNQDRFSPPTIVVSTLSRDPELCIPGIHERRANRRENGVTLLVMTSHPVDIEGERVRPSPHPHLGHSLWYDVPPARRLTSTHQ
jgi:hypothetical protein